MSTETLARFRLHPAWYAARLLAQLRKHTRTVRRWGRRWFPGAVLGQRRRVELRAREAILVGPGAGMRYARFSVRDLGRALRLCLAAGCHDTASELAGALLQRWDELGPAQRRRAVKGLVTSWLFTGDEARLRALVERHGAELEGATLNKLVALYPGVGAGRALEREPVSVSPKEPMLLARSVELGEISAEQLLALLEQHPRDHARNPELDLVLYNGLRGHAADVATAALARYFGSHGLQAPLIEGGAGFPQDFRFRRPVESREGALVSIVMAAYRAADTVTAAIDSLLAQSHRSLEVLVCDDQSDDGTLELLLRTYRSAPNVRIFSTERRQGPYNIRNALLPHCRGEFIAFHDADDLALPVRIARQVAVLGRKGRLACYTNWLRIRGDGSVVFFWDDAANRLCLPSLMFGRHVLSRVRGFRPARFGADLEHRFALEEAFGGRAIVRIRAPLVLGRWSSGSLTRSTGSESLETGYRAPARRAYADVVGRRALLGRERVPDAAIERTLREHGILIAPSPICELTTR